MKKKIFILGSVLVLSIGAIIASAKYTTSCGVEFLGPTFAYFDNEEDYINWLGDMNEISCNEIGNSHLI